VTLAVVTPSYINGPQRAGWARKSLGSLGEAIGEDYLHIVVHDVSDIPKWNATARAIYDRPNLTFVQQPQPLGGVPALLQAVREARRQGAESVFIHLDDNIYIPLFGILLKHAYHAFRHDKELMEVIFTGYPILHRRYSTPQLGNRSCIAVSEDQVSFGSLSLTPTRYQDYTLWWSWFHANMVDGAFWAIFMWQALYRAEFLERLLTFEPVQRITRLGNIESHYKNKRRWQQALQHFSGKLGYINMQFGGLEMHRHGNWQEMVALPNTEVR